MRNVKMPLKIHLQNKGAIHLMYLHIHSIFIATYIFSLIAILKNPKVKLRVFYP